MIIKSREKYLIYILLIVQFSTILYLEFIVHTKAQIFVIIDLLVSTALASIFFHKRDPSNHYKIGKLFAAELSKKANRYEDLFNYLFKEVSPQSVEIRFKNSATSNSSYASVLGIPKSKFLEEKDLTKFSAQLEETIYLAKDLKYNSEVLHCDILIDDLSIGHIRIESKKNQKFTENQIDLIKGIGKILKHIFVNASFKDELIKARLISADTLKDKIGFLSGLSHELRGPLGTILNTTEMIEDGIYGEINTKVKGGLSLIRKTSDHLLDLVNDVLDYGKMEAGKTVVKPVLISAKNLISDMCAVMRSQAVAHGHKLIIEPIPENIGFSCDKRHARQIMINILSNAIKYTPSNGEIRVAIGEQADKILISIADNGVGIDQKDQSKIFMPFERISNGFSELQIGSGLGLSLVKKLVELNGGRISFVSEINKGTTFTIEFKKENINLINDDSSDENRQIKFGDKENILVVNQLDSNGMLIEYLQSQDFNLFYADTLNQISKSITENRIDLVLIDNDGKSVAGDDVVNSIRSNPRTSKTPIILLSSDAFEFDIEQFIRVGVDRIMTKPFPLRELAFSIRISIDFQ